MFSPQTCLFPQLKTIDPCDCQQSINKAVSTAIHQFAESLGNAIDAKDPNTHCHSEEVAVIAHTIGLAMGLSTFDADLLHIAGHLHDIGKIGVPDRVLQKNSSLTTDEWNYIKEHPVIGANILRPVQEMEGMDKVIKMVLHHHERFDGTGYPAGLKGRDIPLGARIVSVADSLSAMLQNRPYREAMTFQSALQILVDESGKQFDPMIVRVVVNTRTTIKELIEMLKQEQC